MFDILARDAAVSDFRRIVYSTIAFTPFHHQAEWQLASEGWTLQYSEPSPGDHYTTISIPDASDTTFTAEQRHQHTLHVARTIVPRVGGIARYCADLAANKAGKSYGAAAWTTGFAILPRALVQFIGAEYSICEPEFTYLCEFLCAEPPRGMNLKYLHHVNDPRNGRMRLQLKRTGTTFECKSWDNKQALKGTKVTAYIYAEAYMLPGMECFTSIAQNIRQLRGWALWPTTADRPWVGALHDMGHGQNPDFHCTCGVRDDVNPITFDQRARDRDDPDKGGIMTREKFEIIHNGRLGVFAGRVYDFNRGQHQFTPLTHPQLWKPSPADAVA